MAYHDTLFQLGMDLTRSSTAQKEDLGYSAQVTARDDAAARSAAVSDDAALGVPAGSPTVATTSAPAGTHVTIDVHGSALLSDVGTVVATLTRLIAEAGASLHHLHVHPVAVTADSTSAAGSAAVSGMAVLNDGHIAFHSRPSAGYAALDISTFGRGASEVWTRAARRVLADARLAAHVHSRGEIAVRTTGEAILSAVLPPVRRERSNVKTLRARAA